MTTEGLPSTEQTNGRPKLEVADIFRAFGPAYRERHVLTPEQREVMAAIETCRTVVLGGHADVCQRCGHVEISYNSCRNRHCPKCQGLAQARWLAQRMERVLPTHYFHVVFTLPEPLRPLVLRNRRSLFDLLFTAASATLLELGHDPNWLGATLGITAVLHTWSRTMRFHPHLHCIVTGGGLSEDDTQWLSTKQDFLFPVRVLSSLFRGKLLDGLRRLYKKGQLDLSGPCVPLSDPATFARLVAELYDTDWCVYAKEPFGGPEAVYAYLGQYTHRVAISNWRLRSFDGEQVSFSTKDGGTETVSAETFIARFLLHVLPKGFVRIRHYGLMAPSNATTRLERARALLTSGDDASGAPLHEVSAPEEDRTTSALSGEDIEDLGWQDLLLLLTGHDVNVCPLCGQGPMVRVALSVVRSPPETPEPRDSS